jgi:hypothetical protein
MSDTLQFVVGRPLINQRQTEVCRTSSVCRTSCFYNIFSKNGASAKTCAIATVK